MLHCFLNFDPRGFPRGIICNSSLDTFKIFSILITVKDGKSIWQIYNDEVIHIFKCYHVIVLSDIKEKLAKH